MQRDWTGLRPEGQGATRSRKSRGRRALTSRPGIPALAASSVAMGALLLTACGGGAGSPSSNAVAHVGRSAPTSTATPDGPTAATGGQATAAASAESVKFASCVRAHGVPNFPDSAVTVTPHGGVEFRLTKGTVDPNSPQLRSALQACQSVIPHAAAGSGPSAHTVGQLLKYAQCMRSHGVPNFPEPNSNGQLFVQVTGGPANNPLNPNSPQFQAASKACRSLQPPGLTGF
jgi:hypothetical protein